jgi:enterochelin esterase-like enzyme
MIAAKALPPVVTVFLESPDRDVEFPPNDAFQRFIGTELLPKLRKHYRLSRDPSRNAVLGSSYGGLAATYTALKHPDVFGNVVSQSGSYGWNTGTLIKRAAEMPKQKIRFYLDAGSWEGTGLVTSNRLLHSVLIGKGYDVTFSESPGTHSSYYWMLRLPDGLQATLGQR